MLNQLSNARGQSKATFNVNMVMDVLYFVYIRMIDR